MNNRNQVIDLFRCIAVLLVTFFHAWRYAGHPQMSIGYFNLLGFMQNGWVGVGVFFVISGYCMGITTRNKFSVKFYKKEYITYVLNRYLRISISYYISIVFWVAIIRYYGVAAKPTGLIDVLTHTLYIHNFSNSTLFSISGVYWTLAVEIQFYILLPFIIILFTTIKSRLVLLFFSVILSVLFSLLFENRILTWSLVVYIPLFLFGWLFLLYQEKISSFIEKYHLLIPIVLLSVLMISLNGFDNDSKLYEMVIAILFGLSMVYMISYAGNFKIIDYLAFIGRCSFSIYLYNYIFYALPVNNILISTLFTIVFGIVMYYLIEKPSNRLRFYLVSLYTTKGN